MSGFSPAHDFGSIYIHGLQGKTNSRCCLGVCLNDFSADSGELFNEKRGRSY